MNNTKEFKLINGIFKPEDASQLIRNFYAEKVRYHNRQLLHMLETQKGDAHSIELKIAELEASSQAIGKLLSSFSNADSLVEVKGAIAITIHQQVTA